MIKKQIEKLINKALGELNAPDFSVEIPTNKNHGDYSTNIAMVLARQLKKNPMQIAEEIAKKIKSNNFKKIEPVKPGFINFFLSEKYLQKQLKTILKKDYKNLKLQKKKINVEFISANPTGPLTLGNGRGGFAGDVLANVLKKAGNKTIKEFYINDKGKQIENLKKGEYKGETRTASQIQKANKKVIEKKLKINFDVWFSEKSLYKNKEIDKALKYLEKNNLTYQKEGALWFKTTKFGDDKDRVLIKENGKPAYFLSDVAYLKNKFERKFSKLIIILGADHHGYVGRMKAAVEALGHEKEQLDFILVQLVKLIENGKEKKMSKRAGIFIELEELVNEVGLDVARFFFLQRAANSHLLFDLELAKKKSQENPVYYVQYANARICSILKRAKVKPGESFDNLNNSLELDLIKQLLKYEEIIQTVAEDYQVQRLPQYSIELAELVHRFYHECPVLSGDKEFVKSRLSLLLAVQKILKDVLGLMGISAPSKM
jgi:arginyl-tRNA synthetase